MLQAIKIAIIAAFAHTVEGHVRALPTGANGFGCRECNGKASPGPFRVNGALGGNKAFGANGECAGSCKSVKCVIYKVMK